MSELPDGTLVAFKSGHCYHRVRDGRARCNTGGKLGETAHVLEPMEAQHRGLEPCRICTAWWAAQQVLALGRPTDHCIYCGDSLSRCECAS